MLDKNICIKIMRKNTLLFVLFEKKTYFFGINTYFYLLNSFFVFFEKFITT